MQARQNFQKLLDYNQRVLDQALQVIDAHQAHPTVNYAESSGPHLRHLIEHYEAFTCQVADRSVDYDARARDAAVERDAALARARLLRVQAQLRAMAHASIEDPIAIHLRGGLAGEDNFVCFSTAERELLFLASHAAHHYALVRLHCQGKGIELGADFGKAPSTVHHEQRR